MKKVLGGSLLSWKEKKINQELLGKEQNVAVFAPGSRFAFAFLYPNVYKVGMSNLGLHVLYRQINLRGDTACERFFLPDGQKSNEAVSLLSMETQRELTCFSIVGVMLSFEMDYFNFLTMLDLAKIPLLSNERDDSYPLIVAGGPCAAFNPEPMADFVDAFVIGEGEDTVDRIIDCIQQNESLSKKELLLLLANIAGVYVPRFYQPIYAENGQLVGMQNDDRVPATIQRQWVEEIDIYEGSYEIITPETEFSNMFALEVARGCGRHCRFCMAGYCFRCPRNRDLEQLWQAIVNRPSQSVKVGLLGAAVCDYPHIAELTKRLVDNEIKFSVSSIRADTLDVDFAKALAKSGQKTLTVAPEAGSERLRKVINKGIDENDILHCVDIAAEAGIANIRLYFMLGLPTEGNDDIMELIGLVGAVRSAMRYKKGKLTLSINPFIPKPFTPFQWDEMVDVKTFEQRINLIKDAFKKDKSIDVKVESFKSSVVQLALARGDRNMGKLVLQCQQNGGVKEFGRLLKSNAKYDKTKDVQRSYGQAEYLPWQHLDMGFGNDYLVKERINADNEVFTQQCFSNCRRCGICKG